MTDGVQQGVVFIAGPTATGKSAAALRLAELLDGEIVNADAIQVYRDLEILSARPGADDLARAPHHLYGRVDGAVRCSAGKWARAASSVLAGIAERGRLAIVVGGTGLYFRALSDGLSPIPDVADEIRAAARARLQLIGAEAFGDEVAALDPSATPLAGDAQRLLRAWEVHAATGRSLAEFQQSPGEPAAPAPLARVVIEPDRALIYQACESRFDAMVAHGALDEARRLAARALAPDLPVMKAVGAAELIAHVRGELSMPAAIERAKRNSRRLVKRQLTWFRHQAADWPRFSSSELAVEALQSQLNN